MKYYTYISDSKIDMLLPQIPHEVKKKMATKFGFDLSYHRFGSGHFLPTYGALCLMLLELLGALTGLIAQTR